MSNTGVYQSNLGLNNIAQLIMDLLLDTLQQHPVSMSVWSSVQRSKIHLIQPHFANQPGNHHRQLFSCTVSVRFLRFRWCTHAVTTNCATNSHALGREWVGWDKGG